MPSPIGVADFYCYFFILQKQVMRVWLGWKREERLKFPFIMRNKGCRTTIPSNGWYSRKTEYESTDGEYQTSRPMGMRADFLCLALCQMAILEAIGTDSGTYEPMILHDEGPRGEYFYQWILWERVIPQWGTLASCSSTLALSLRARRRPIFPDAKAVTVWYFNCKLTEP